MRRTNVNPIGLKVYRKPPILMLALSLSWPLACGAVQGAGIDAAQAAPVETAPAVAQDQSAPANGQAEAGPPAARVPRQHVRRAPGHGIDETVSRLTRGLQLDEAQQKKLREILWDEQKQVWHLRQNPGAGVDWASATATIIGQTKTRIRAILNDEQKQKYVTDVPRDETAPAKADVEHWMKLQESQRLQDEGPKK